MKFIQSNLAKKLIIILITLLVFNVFYPSLTYAVDFGGMLLEPIYWLLCSVYIPVDLTLGSLLTLDYVSFTDISIWSTVLLGGWNKIGDSITDIVNGVKKIINFFKPGTTEPVEDWGTKLGKIKLSNTSFWGAITGVYGDKTISELFVGPDTIFKGEISFLNANIFDHIDKKGNITAWDKASHAVASFYIILRNIAAVVMLAGLLYIGIQILLSSNIPTKKTQYLMMLQDWLIGMAILIFSHIIMILIFELAEAITTALSRSFGTGSIKWDLIKNMMYSKDQSTQTIALLIYHWLQILTIIFVIAYFKRFFWTCVLVVFAPVFPIMYAFGQQTKQIYTNWLKEFIMNAMVQPFHLVVYTVLILIPLNITDSGGWNWSFENGGEIIYALMAMSMIRPAEKYLRRMFGFDKGVANMASYDSGKQTITDIGKAVMAVAKTVATIYTGGAAAALKIGGAAAGGLLGGSAGAKAGSAIGDMAGNAIKEGGNQAFKELDKATDGSSSSTPESISDGWDRDSQGPYLNPNNDEGYTEDELMSGRDLPGYTDQDDFSESDIKSLTDGIKNSTADSIESREEISESPSEFMRTLRENSEAKDQNLTDQEVAKAVGSESVASMLKEAGFNNEQIASYLGTAGQNATELNANNITINASSVNMDEKAGSSNNNEIKTIDGANIEGANIDGDVDTEGANQEVSNDGEITIEGLDFSGGLMEAFANAGGLEQIGTLANDIIDGVHSISSGLYVDGTAPTSEWNANSQWRRNNIKEMGEKRKEKVEREKDNWAHNKANINVVAEKYYLPQARQEMQERYGGSKDAGYIESMAKERAQEKAKAAMKDMSAYVPYGVRDVDTAYKLYKNANDNNFTPQQSIMNMAGYNKFNSSPANIGAINLSGTFERNNYKSVEEAIPNAKAYYDAGHTDINEMAWIEKMAHSLGCSPEFAMRIDEALSRRGGGNIKYSGKDPAMEAKIDSILNHYRKKK